MDERFAKCRDDLLLFGFATCIRGQLKPQSMSLLDAVSWHTMDVF